MLKLINWKRNWFNAKFELFTDGIQKGAIVFSAWKSDANTTFEDQNYLFKNTGCWKSKTQIFDRKTNEMVATISYDHWKSKAFINMESGAQYEWKATNFWKSQFTVTNYHDANIVYSCSGNSGSISADTDNSLLIISGLFIKQIYNKRGAALVACFVPIMISITRHH